MCVYLHIKLLIHRSYKLLFRQPTQLMNTTIIKSKIKTADTFNI